MPTDIEVRLMRLLNSIELRRGLAGEIEAMGTEAVTVVCDAALGTYVGQRPWIRNRAAALVGVMRHPQAVETLALLVASDSAPVSRRALRAVRRRERHDLVPDVQGLLDREDTPPTLAAEAVLTLAALNTKPARAAIAKYESKTGGPSTHRSSPVVRRALSRSARA